MSVPAVSRVFCCGLVALSLLVSGYQTATAAELDLEKLAGIAEVHNFGLSPTADRLLVLGISVTATGLAHEAWLIDLRSQPPTANKLLTDPKADCRFAWSADGRTLMTFLNEQPRYWSTNDATEVTPPSFPKEVLPADVKLGSEFSAADKVLQQSGYKSGRGWVTDFSSSGAACCPLGGISTIAFPGRPADQETDTDAWWLRFAPEGRALFWVAKDQLGTLYRVTPEDTIHEKVESSPKSRVARLDNLFAVGKHGAEVRSAALNADGSRAFTAGIDGLVRAWDVSHRKRIAELNGIAGLPVKVSELWGLELSKDATHLIILAQPLDKTQPKKPGRMWIQKLDWPAHPAAGDEKSPGNK